MVQSTTHERDTAHLRREDLLADYSKISSRRDQGAEATALRNNWREFREILAYQVTGGMSDYAELERKGLAGLLETGEIVSPEALGSLGVISIVSEGRLVNTDFGVLAIETAIGLLPKNRHSYRFRKILTEYYLRIRNRSSALDLLDLYPDIDRDFYGYMRLDTMNPYVFPEGSSDWLEAFNEPFVESGMAPVTVKQEATIPFVGLEAGASADISEFEIKNSPLVSVVMAQSKVRDELIASACQSVLDQTWKHLELVLVYNADEPLAPQTQEMLERDGRVVLLSQLRSGGYYADLNAGIGRARGDFITFQSASDWSHPERLERQVRELQFSQNDKFACVAQGITSNLELERSVLARKPVFFNPHSLMLSREGMDNIGGFLPVNSGGALELCERIDALSEKSLVNLPLPLTLSLVDSEESISYTSTLEWSHASYRMFECSYRHWHRHARPNELCVTPNSRPSVKIPSPLSYEPEPDTPELDIVLAGDWTRFGGPQKSMMEEIRALLKDEVKVGIMSLEAGRFMERVPRPLCSPIQELINEGLVSQVLPDDQVEVDLLILRYPPILQFVGPASTAINAKRAVILANQAPSELDGSDIRYLIEDCEKNAERFFTCPYIWVPQGPQVREALVQGGLSSTRMTEFDMPGIIDPEEWYVARAGFRGAIPVAGRHSRDNDMKWPDNASDLKKVYPVDGKLDVRVMGGAKAPLKVLGYALTPPGWTIYEADEVPVKTFLAGLDYFVFYQHSRAVEAFGRAILEAIASGVLVILPPHFEPVFGVAAVYREMNDVLSTIREFHNDRDLYSSQVRGAMAVVEEKFSHESYIKIVERFRDESIRVNA